MVNRRLQRAVCAVVLVLAAPAVAARPAHHRHARAALPERSTVTVHRGVIMDAGPRFAAPYPGGDESDIPGVYREADYGREDDAALFAARYGCARPIWNAKSNRYMSACN